MAHRAGPQISAYLQLEDVKQTVKSDDHAILSGVTGTSPVTTENQNSFTAAISRSRSSGRDRR